MAELTIDDLTIEQGGMIAVAANEPGGILTEREIPKKKFKPLVKLGIFDEYEVIERHSWMTTDDLLKAPRITEFQLTEYGYQLLHEGLNRFYATLPLPANVTMLWDTEPIQAASAVATEPATPKKREPYKTKKIREAEAKLQRWNALASGN